MIAQLGRSKFINPIRHIYTPGKLCNVDNVMITINVSVIISHFITEVTFTTTADDSVFVWVDGVFQYVKHWNSNMRPGTFNIGHGKHLLAISAVDHGGLAGILWSATNGLVSDSSTICSTTHQPDWNQPDAELIDGVTAQITPPPPDWTIPGYNLDYTLGIVWELPDYTPRYNLGAPRVYPTSPDYTPPDSGWGIVWAIGVHSGRYHI